MIYSWQQAAWQHFSQSYQLNRLPHALLLVGVAGLGKAEFAEYLAKRLLCQDLKENHPCHTCHTCTMIKQRTHTNVLWVESEKMDSAIKVDQIREVGEFIQQTALQPGYRIVIIHRADLMNINAANSLLKTLEEPTPQSLLILTCEQSLRLPATVLSRCQQLSFPRPTRNEALVWLSDNLPVNMQDQAELLLDLTNGAPLSALKWAKNDVLSMRQMLFESLCQLVDKKSDPVTIAANLQDVEVMYFLDFTLSWIMDILRLQCDETTHFVVNKDYLDQLQQLTKNYPTKKSVSVMNYLQQLRAQVCAGIHFNKPLLMESVLMKWLENV